MFLVASCESAIVPPRRTSFQYLYLMRIERLHLHERESASRNLTDVLVQEAWCI